MIEGIHLTKQAKEEIEAKIMELDIETHGSSAYIFYKSGAMSVLKSILSSATILPVEESWNRLDVSNYCKDKYPNGVIIQSKK